MNEPLPPLTAHLLDLFHGPLRDVRFPDADADRLSTAIDAVVSARDSVADAEAALEAARGTLAEKSRLLAQETDRALAYARIYAAERPELRAVVDAVPARTAAPRRGPGRPRKAKVAVETADAAE